MKWTVPKRWTSSGAMGLALLGLFPGAALPLLTPGADPPGDATLGVTATAASSASSGDASASRRLALVGLQTGLVHLDIPHPERPGESFGTRFRLGMQLGYEITSRFGVDGELGFSFLGESDSLNAILVSQGRAPGAAYTLVDASLGLLGRWPLGGGRWAPFVRASGGIVSLALSSPDGGSRSTDPLWSLGCGVEIAAVRSVLLRLQGRWLGQPAGTTRHHAAAELALFYALHARSFADEAAPGPSR